MKKSSMYFLVLIGAQVQAMCPACESQQPKILFGLSHGLGPTNNWDWVIIGLITFVTLLTLVCSVIYLIRPKEKSLEHIKNRILTF